MTKHGDLVVTGFLELSEADRKEVIEVINRYLNQDESAHASFSEWYEKKARGRILAGPVSPSKCPCCGN